MHSAECKAKCIMQNAQCTIEVSQSDYFKFIASGDTLTILLRVISIAKIGVKSEESKPSPGGTRTRPLPVADEGRGQVV